MAYELLWNKVIVLRPSDLEGFTREIKDDGLWSLHQGV